MSTKIGHVSQRQYERYVERGRELVELQTKCQFALGDYALRIEPVQTHGGQHVSHTSTVDAVLGQYASDVGVPLPTLLTYRYVAASWPKEHRRKRVSFYIHKILSPVPIDANEDPGGRGRYAVLDKPPDGQEVWTCDAAARYCGRKPAHPATMQEKIIRIRELAKDEAVATAVTNDFLRRPEVAAKAMADPVTRAAVNDAQYDRSRQVRERLREDVPVVRALEHSIEFANVVSLCAAFTAGVERALPELRTHQFSPDERDTVRQNLDRVRTSTDWVQSAVDAGGDTWDEQFARMQRED